MERRQLIGAIGAVGVGSVAVGLAYQLDQGNISLGEQSDLSATVSGTPESFDLEVVNGADVRISVTDTRDAPYGGAFTLQDPDGNDVLDGGPRSSEMAMRTHTAQRGGTYRLLVDPQGTRLRVSVLIQEPSE